MKKEMLMLTCALVLLAGCRNIQVNDLDLEDIGETSGYIQDNVYDTTLWPDRFYLNSIYNTYFDNVVKIELTNGFNNDIYVIEDSAFINEVLYNT